MNNLEKRMIDILLDLKENHNVIGVKAEFEAEGALFQEVIRLKEIALKAGLDLTIKIGGCEALKDLYETRMLGASCIIAPMIESDYALKKFLSSIKRVFAEDERNQISFFINIETINGFNNFDKMLNIDEINELNGITLGRYDITKSLGLPEEQEDSEKILNIAKILFNKAKNRSLECCMGGGISVNTVDFIKKLPQGYLDKYETRKIIFKYTGSADKSVNQGILKAINFELMWLQNKKEFYGILDFYNEQRLNIIKNRYEKLVNEIIAL